MKSAAMALGSAPRTAAGPWEKLARWAAAALWFAFILFLSQDSFASARTEAWLARFLAWWGIYDETLVERLNFIVRKSAHFVEYAIFGALLYQAWERTWPARRALAAAVFLAALGAGCDEIGQSQHAWRTGAVRDVALDAFGGAVGALAVARGWLMRLCARAAAARVRG